MATKVATGETKDVGAEKTKDTSRQLSTTKQYGARTDVARPTGEEKDWGGSFVHAALMLVLVLGDSAGAGACFRVL